ncbi:hypothetical protein F3Y22_tig00110895pilonHSYRG00846 [Hibiscus syriacus]|uniref:Uncharacterized protein n=1 Tax=Hibiscus syriacus TaxID=106335 RepID=A0A6A2ZHW9_HIBSY|nr:hypothetical protein F3Y22_tig00110895pilonHSYRG00846 [Hibiscus syriacus]
MEKLAVYLATFALVLFIAHVSITTVTFDEEENTWRPSRRSQSSCQEQIREQDHLQDCQIHGGTLEKLENQCRCPGLKHVAMQQMKGQMGREEMPELYEAAEKIMSKCDMKPRRCDFHLATGSNGP